MSKIYNVINRLIKSNTNIIRSNGLIRNCLSCDSSLYRSCKSLCSLIDFAGRETPFYYMDTEATIHNGGCHCRKVRWQVKASDSIVAWKCNCSNCEMRGNTHFIVPADNFDLLDGSKEFLTTYTFGSHTAKHIFCKVCGITSFYIPRSNPDGVAVTFRCVDPGTVRHVEIRNFDGRNWEDSYQGTGIASCSKGT